MVMNTENVNLEEVARDDRCEVNMYGRGSISMQAYYCLEDSH